MIVQEFGNIIHIAYVVQYISYSYLIVDGGLAVYDYPAALARVVFCNAGCRDGHTWDAYTIESRDRLSRSTHRNQIPIVKVLRVGG